MQQENSRKEKNWATVYIDGFNLYHGLMDKGMGSCRWLDLFALSQKLLPPKYELRMVRYFSTRIKGDPAGHNRQTRYLAALRAHLGDKIDMKFGRFQLFPSRCKHCGKTPVYCSSCMQEYSKPNEKKTDVNLTTMMLTDCFEKLTNCVVLVSGDGDYETAWVELHRIFPKIERVIAFPPKRRNPRLYAPCESYFDIPKKYLLHSQLPDPVKNPKNSKTYQRPDEWK